MRTTTLLREVSRNLTSGTGRVGLFASVAIAVLSLIMLSELLTVAGLVRQGVEYRAAGSAITTLALPGRINGEACEALAQTPEVIAAGAMREAPPISLSALPSSPLKQYVVTPSFPGVLDASENGRGAYFSDEVSQAVGWGDVSVAGRLVPTRGTYRYPSDGRRAGFGWAMLLPTHATDRVFDECWVQVWPERSDIRRLLMTTITSASETASREQPQIAQLNTSLGVEFSGVQNYVDRPSRFASFIALVAGVFLGLVAVWVRRIEIAANIHAGSARVVINLQYAIEVVAWSLPAALCGWSIGCVVAALGAPMELAPLTTRSAQIALVFLAGSVLGGLIGTSLVREPKLWSYVKGR